MKFTCPGKFEPSPIQTVSALDPSAVPMAMVEVPSDTDEVILPPMKRVPAGRMPSTSKVAVAAIVGNEDGAHNASAQLFQSLNDTGWTIPAAAACYWVGEAMGSVDFKDLEHRPRKVTETAKMVAANAAHLARLLKTSPYPG